MRINARLALGLNLAAGLSLAACSTSQPGVEIRTVEIATPVACLSADDIPAEPAKVGDQLTGDARTDVSILAESALELRKWGQTLSAMLHGCTEGD